MDQQELDLILQVIENPVRRRIIRRLSQEPCYVLQLSKEFGLGQPLVAKHMAIMEHAGMVTSSVEASPNGPARKKYALVSGLSISMDIGPNLFIERGLALDARPGNRDSRTQGAGQARRKLQAATALQDGSEKLSAISNLLADVDRMLEKVEADRIELLEIRNEAMREASKVARELDGPDKRRVLFHVLDEHDMKVDRISETLNLREFTVRSILDELRELLE
jgi:predicted transcriptional regulator